MTAYIHSHCRRGTTITELVVACGLLSSLMLLVVPSAIRMGRVQQATRHERIALDEVTNQLERLTQLPVNELPQEIDQLAPSDFAMGGLPNPELSGTLQNSEDGYRLALEISWDRPGQPEAPLTVATWVYPAATTRPTGEDPAP